MQSLKQLFGNLYDKNAVKKQLTGSVVDAVKNSNNVMPLSQLENLANGRKPFDPDDIKILIKTLI
jgi:hypothetical protein